MKMNRIEYNGQMLSLTEISQMTRIKEEVLQNGMDSTGDIYKAIFIARYGKTKLDELETYYSKLDLKKFLNGEERRALPNLQAARIIVEDVFRDLNINIVGEQADVTLMKRALDYLLKHPYLKMNSEFSGSLAQIVIKTRKEARTKEIATKVYKLIIYLSARSYYADGKTRITYPALLSTITFQDTFEHIKSFLNRGNDIQVSDLLKVLEDRSDDNTNSSNNHINEGESSRIISYFEEMGLLGFINVGGQLIYSYWNLEQASQIVEEYFGETISKEKKRAVLMCILGSPLLRENNIKKTCNLAELVGQLNGNGLERNEIFAIIINCGIDGKMLEHSYGKVLLGVDDSFISKVKENSNRNSLTIVHEETLNRAVSKSRDKAEEADICEYYKKLGLDSLIYNNSGKSLMYPESELIMARRITEGYFRSEGTADEVKKAVLRSLLSHQTLKLTGEVVFDKLATVINIMKEKGVEERDVYGFLINFSYEKFTKKYGCTYHQVLQNPELVDNILQGKYDTVVNLNTLAAMIKSNQKRRRTWKRRFRNGSTGDRLFCCEKSGGRDEGFTSSSGYS